MTIMKKTRFFVALLVMLVAASGYAQDSYRDALKEYLFNLGQSDYDPIKSILDYSYETYFKQSDDVDLEKLTERFLNEALIDQLVDFSEPMMKERNVTEADLRTLNAMLSTPEGQTFLAHQNEWDDKLNEISYEHRKLFQDGGEPEALQVNPDIDAGYVAKFQKMWNVIEEQTMGMINGLFPSEMPSEMAGEMTDELADEMAESSRIKTWLNSNYGTLALNTAYGILTPEDLDFGTKLFANESYRKATDTAGASPYSLLGEGAGFLMDSLMKYFDWMESQGAQPTEKLIGLKRLMNLQND